MTFWYTARKAFNKDYGQDAWEDYKQWIKLPQLTDLISLDGALNEDIISGRIHYIPDCAVIKDGFVTNFYTSLDFVINEVKDCVNFHLFAVVANPLEECNNSDLINFEFIGYDLLDQEYGNSAITNCGGYYETYSPNDINQFGLIGYFEKAVDIKEKLLINNPKEPHADTNVFAIWRHKTIGR